MLLSLWRKKIKCALPVASRMKTILLTGTSNTHPCWVKLQQPFSSANPLHCFLCLSPQTPSSQMPLMPAIFAQEYFLRWNAPSPFSSWRPPTIPQIPANAALLRSLLCYLNLHALPQAPSSLVYQVTRWERIGGVGGMCTRSSVKAAKR